MKSDAKHTPGPWEAGGIASVALSFDREIYIFPPDAEQTGGYQYGGPIAVVAVDDDAGGTANARLIAAAPDLLSACEAWDTGFVDGEQFDAEQFRVWVNERRAMARAAIAKAKGRPTQ